MMYKVFPVLHVLKSSVTTWMDLDGIMLISQIKKYNASKSDGKGQKPYDFTNMWNIKQKVSNKVSKQNKNKHRHKNLNGGYQRGRAVWGE